MVEGKETEKMQGETQDVIKLVRSHGVQDHDPVLVESGRVVVVI